MTAPDRLARTLIKPLANRGRPHMTTPFVYSILAFIVSSPPSGTSPSPILRTPAGVPAACSSRSDRTKQRAPPVASPRPGGTGLLPRLLVPLPHHLGRRDQVSDCQPPTAAPYPASQLLPSEQRAGRMRCRTFPRRRT